MNEVPAWGKNGFTFYLRRNLFIKQQPCKIQTIKRKKEAERKGINYLFSSRSCIVTAGADLPLRNC